MILRSMTATFGALENARLELEPGLNLLEMPNEGGKSTWCAFLRGMFYGLESRKGGAFSERNRYTPWSGAPMAGEVELTWQGRDITLRRFPKGTDPFGGFSATYTGTGEAVPGLTAANVGEIVLGCTREVFERAAFIAQGGIRVTESGELERRLTGLATAGEEDVSFDRAYKQLKSWRNSRQANRSTGAIPRLEARLDEASRQKARTARAREELERAGELLKGKTARLCEVDADLRRHEARQAAAELERYEKARAGVREGEDALARAKRDCEAAGERARREREEAAKPGKERFLLPAAVLAAVTAALAAAALFLKPGLFPVAAAAAAAAVLCAFWLLREDKKHKQAIRLVWGRHTALMEQAEGRLREAQTRLDAARAVWEAVSVGGEPPLPPTGAPERPRRPLDEDRRQKAALEREIAHYTGERHRLTGMLEAEGPPQEDEAALREELSRLREERDAITLAMDALERANATLQSRFSPAVSARASEFLARLTGEKYTAVTFSRQFQGEISESGHARVAQLLSQGTADQVYLALRLAVCELTFQSDPPPLVLDDALVTFDDARLALALEVLKELAGKEQVLLFTCQSRERIACNSTGKRV